MFSGLKFIPRDHIGSAQDENITDSGKKRHKSSDSSSNDEEVGRIKKNSRRKKWYSSDEDSSSYSSDSGSEQDTRVSRSRRRGKKKKHNSRSEDKDKVNSKRSRRKNYSSGDSFDGEDRKDRRKKGNGRPNKELEDKDGADGESDSLSGKNIMRKEMGLEWMLRPKNDAERMMSVSTPDEPEEPSKEEVKKINPRELNPYFKDDGSGFPEDADGHIAGSSNLLSTSVVGDGGASWRLKALKRAQEQAAREGRKLDEVVEERWGSLGQLAVSVASRSAAPSRAHIGAIKSRIRRQTEEQQTVQGNHHDTDRESMNEESIQHPKMRVPKVHDSLSWEKRKSQSMSVKDAGLISSAMASLNKFSNDGSFMSKFLNQQNDYSARNREEVSVSLESERLQKSDANVRPALGANQLAAKVLQLRMKGKHEEADKLLKEAEECKDENNVGSHPSMTARQGTTSRYLMQTTNMRQKKKEEDADIHLAQTIVKNKQYKVSAQADDEYDYDGDPVKKKKKKAAIDPKSTVKNSFTHRILTQQERCNFCFENPTRPRHLVVSIANGTYLMLPMSPPVVAGHCYILPVQHESATRSVDNSVWDEIRNFKKCLIMMFAKQEKDVIFLETAMGFTKQRRHCLVECIPLPQEIARQGPLYFKKAIDEAEEEWSQHNAKKLIDTSEKGLRGSIPKDFPYFHVEFGLKKGFVHVIDDESQFKSNFGINVIRGMLRMPAEDMHRRQRHDSLETQKQAVASFARDWEPFDWTKQLD